MLKIATYVLIESLSVSENNLYPYKSEAINRVL